MKMNLRSKDEVSRLWRLGAFGNKIRSWDHPDQVPRLIRHSNRFSLRSLVPGGPFHHNMSYGEMVQRFKPGENYVCEPAPDEYRVVQGEIMRDVGGLYFRFSFEPETLRTALLRADGTVLQKTGYAVECYLRRVMSPLSWIELNDCLDLDDAAVVEFTVFNRDVGDRPGCNSIIWEVRLY